MRQIAENAGVEGSVVVDRVRDMKTGSGFNAATGEYEDLVSEGVIDPTMVTRSALQNAASIAKNILTTECVVAEAPEKEPVGMPGGGDARHGDVRTRAASLQADSRVCDGTAVRGIPGDGLEGLPREDLRKGPRGRALS